MFMVVHAAVGAAAGQAVAHSSAAFLLGVISHFFLDMIPHGDEGIYQGYISGSKVKRAYLHVGIDLLMTAMFVVVMFSNPQFASPSVVAWGVFGAVLPDLLVGISQAVRPKKQSGIFYRLDLYNRFHRWNHAYAIKRWRKAERDISFLSGLVFQGVLMFVLVRYVL
jgi:hypothetical protein